ncbi:MAG: NACHT domain-containing protein [Nostoc sp.]
MYNWKRFWCPNTGNIKLDYGGFLEDPELEHGHITNPDVVPFSAISHIPCLVLLGEPGIGKTTAAEQAYKQVQEQVRESKDDCLWFNLGDFDSNQDLSNRIFQNEIFIKWINGTHKLHLFLDSLDEGLLSFKIIVRTLKNQIEHLPTERLYFRITCRTSVWLESSTLEQKLKEKWKKSNTKIYELAPLRRVDVIEAAQVNNINSDDFIQEILNREATPFAIKPVTLKFLIGTYKNRQLPDSKKELYKQGCLQLCEEVNPERLQLREFELNSYQRLIIAGRLAVIMIFAQRTAIWTSPEIAYIPHSDIDIRDLCIGKESINMQSFPIKEKDIRDEILSITGLFSSRGSNRMGFAHQTYAEFLAAWYLIEHNIPLVQVMSLIVSQEDPECKLVPQLHETAAWLASMRTDILEEIINTDPDVLLRSDIPTDGKIREKIVDTLLKYYNDGKLLNRDLGSYFKYKKLKHPGLAEQLRPYIHQG